MVRKKLPPKVVIHNPDQNRLISFFMLLVEIDKSINAKKAKTKKTKDTRSLEISLLKCRPIFLHDFVYS